MNNKVGIGYIRVSTKKQADEGVSLSVQKREVEKKLMEYGCEKVIVFEDEGKSGKSIAGRDGFRQAIQKACELEVQYFCTYDTSRFARNTEEAIKTVQLLRSNDIELICVTAKFDDTPEGKLIFSMLATIDQFYSDQLGAKIKKSLKKKRQEGYFMGKAPKGYSNIRIEGIADIVVNQDGRALQQTFQNYLSGKIETLREIAVDLDKNGFEPGKKTHFQLAGRLFRTPFYAGMFWDNNTQTYIDHVYEKLISKDDWYFIQDKMNGRKLQTNSYKIHHPDYPLRSITYCSNCGRKLKGYPCRGNGGIYHYYDCPTVGCIRAVRTGVLHSMFGEEISKMGPGDELLALFKEILKRSLSEGLSNDFKKSQLLTKRVNDLKSERQKTLDKITQVESTEIVKALEEKFKEINRLIQQYENESIEAKKVVSKENCEPIIEEGTLFLKNPYDVWQNASPKMRHQYQSWLFPKGIEYDPNYGLRTRELCLTFELLCSLKKEDSHLVETVGIEPTSKSTLQYHYTNLDILI